VHRDRPARAERRALAANKIDVADTLKFLVVRYTGRAIAEADLGPQVDCHSRPAIGSLTVERDPFPIDQWEMAISLRSRPADLVLRPQTRCPLIAKRG
jgi:hypothetical protein